MPRRSPAVDAYIAPAPAFARPLLTRIREACHAGCPGLEERIKWGAPSFEHLGMLGGMAAFQRHVAFGSWKSPLMEDLEGLFRRGPRASAMGVMVTSAKDLSPKRVLVACVRQARRPDEEGAREPRLARPAGSIRVVPADLKAALARSAKASATSEASPPSARRDYVDWLTDARRPQTRARRLATTLEWLAQGKRRSCKYERRC